MSSPAVGGAAVLQDVQMPSGFRKGPRLLPRIAISKYLLVSVLGENAWAAFENLRLLTKFWRCLPGRLLPFQILGKPLRCHPPGPAVSRLPDPFRSGRGIAGSWSK